MNRSIKLAHIIEGLLAIAQGLFLIGLSAIVMFFVYAPLSLAMIIIFGIIGSICFLCGIESIRNNAEGQFLVEGRRTNSILK
jgi:hypothetical protein